MGIEEENKKNRKPDNYVDIEGVIGYSPLSDVL